MTNNGLLLSGIDGTNPLGFLAALGVLRILTLGGENAKLKWIHDSGTRRPKIIGTSITLLEIGQRLHETIQRLDNSAWSINDRLPFRADEFRDCLRNASNAASRKCRDRVDTLTSFGVECYQDDRGTFEKTNLCMLRSADSSGQGMTAYGKRIIETRTYEEIQRAIQYEWSYLDEQCALRLDPSEDKPYSLQWNNPSSIGALSEKGANCLALFGLACFPVIPTRRGAETVGFGLSQQRVSIFTWPIWKYALNVDACRSLIALNELQTEQPDRKKLVSLGIEAVYRCERIMTSKYYANFMPSRQIA